MVRTSQVATHEGGGGGMHGNYRERIQPNLNMVACWW